MRALALALSNFAAACDREELGTMLLDGAAQLGARAAALLLVHDGDLVLSHARGFDVDHTRKLAVIALDDAAEPIAQAARERCPMWSHVRHERATVEPSEADTDALRHDAALPLLSRGRTIGVLVLSFAEGTELLRARRERFELLATSCGRAIERASRFEQLEQRIREEEHLLGIASHDLRSPLHLITMASDLLANQVVLSAAQQTVLTQIGDSAKRAASMVGQLLDFSKVQLTGLRISAEREDVFAILRECVEDFRVRVPKCRIDLSVEGSGEARVDRDRLVQVVHNLIANAVQYREAESAIEVRGEGLEQRVYIEVKNRGPLIGPELMSELFSPLRRGAQGGEPGSLGLGLFIVKRLIEAHGGRVWVRSTESEGTTFVLEVPREPQCDELQLLPPPAEPRQYMAAPAAVPPEYGALHDALDGGPLRSLLQHWFELGGATHLPHPRKLDRARFSAWLPDMFSVEVACTDRARCFRFIDVGGELERRLGLGPLRALVRAPPDDTLATSFFAAYDCCAETRRPVYDYLCMGTSRSGSDRFARLVLPFSRDAQRVTHLIGIALFTGLAEARGRGSDLTLSAP